MRRSRPLRFAGNDTVRDVSEIEKKIGNDIGAFFSKIALKYDIRRPEDWYRLDSSKIKEEENGFEVLKQYDNLLVNALSKLYSNEHDEHPRRPSPCSLLFRPSLLD